MSEILPVVYTSKVKQVQDPLIETARMMDYAGRQLFGRLKPFEGQANTEALRLQIKMIIEQLLQELHAQNIIAPDIVLQSVKPNPWDSTQVEVTFARGDYTSTFYQ